MLNYLFVPAVGPLPLPLDDLVMAAQPELGAETLNHLRKPCVKSEEMWRNEPSCGQNIFTFCAILAHPKLDRLEDEGLLVRTVDFGQVGLGELCEKMLSLRQ